MSEHRLFEINSAHRNRRQFPNQADFDIPIAQLGSRTTLSTSLDPITDQYPILVWNQNIPVYVSPFDGGSKSTPIITIPGVSIDNTYVGLQVVDTTLAPDFRTFITASVVVGAHTYIAVDPPFPDTWRATDAYTLSPVMNDGINTPLEVIVNNGSSAENAYTGMEIMAFGPSYTPQYREVVYYDGVKRLAILESAFPAVWTNIAMFAMFRTRPNQVGYCTAGTASTITLDVGANPDPTFYIGKYITVLEYVNTYETGCVITGYDPATRIVTFTPSIGQVFSAPVNKATYAIMTFTKDNYNPFNYVSSVLAQQEVCCYEIILHSIVLPNVPLSTFGIGGYVINVPYVYVEFYNLNLHSNDVLYTNSPFAAKALFFVSLTDYPQSSDSPFVRVNSSVRQTIKIKPNEDLHFTVRLPNGNIMRTLNTDVQPPPYNAILSHTYSICEPIENLQIVALFSIKKL